MIFLPQGVHFKLPLVGFLSLMPFLPKAAFYFFDNQLLSASLTISIRCHCSSPNLPYFSLIVDPSPPHSILHSPSSSSSSPSTLTVRVIPHNKVAFFPRANLPLSAHNWSVSVAQGVRYPPPKNLSSPQILPFAFFFVFHNTSSNKRKDFLLSTPSPHFNHFNHDSQSNCNNTCSNLTFIPTSQQQSLSRSPEDTPSKFNPISPNKINILVNYLSDRSRKIKRFLALGQPTGGLSATGSTSTITRYLHRRRSSAATTATAIISTECCSSSACHWQGPCGPCPTPLLPFSLWFSLGSP